MEVGEGKGGRVDCGGRGGAVRVRFGIGERIVGVRE